MGTNMAFGARKLLRRSGTPWGIVERNYTGHMESKRAEICNLSNQRNDQHILRHFQCDWPYENHIRFLEYIQMEEGRNNV